MSDLLLLPMVLVIVGVGRWFYRRYFPNLFE